MPDTYTLLADVIVPSVFMPYLVERTAIISALWQSGIVQPSAEFNALVNASGKLIDMPFWTEFDQVDQVINTDTTLTVKKLAGSDDQARKQMRGIPVGAEDLVKRLANTEDPITLVAGMFADYWARRFQDILISSLKGVFGAANMAGSILNIFTETGLSATIANQLNGSTFVDAAVLLGDASGKLTAVAMHSATRAALQKADLIEFLPDSDGKLTLRSFQGHQIIEDDRLPVRDGTTNGKVYTTYLFGAGAFAFGEGDLGNPVEGGHGTEALELERTALKSETAVISRRQFMLHPRGVKWTESSVASTHPTNTELETAANWTRVYEQKNVRIVQVNHNN